MYNESMIYFVDLDGTIVKRNKLIFFARKLKGKKGVFISTGRTFESAKKFYKLLKPQYSIFDNGQVVYKDKNILWDFRFSEKAIKILISQGHFINKAGQIVSKKIIDPNSYNYFYNNYSRLYEISKKGVSKGETEAKLAKFLKRDFFHIGDSFNDQSAIGLAKKTYAIKNSYLANSNNVIIIKRKQIIDIVLKGKHE